MGKYEEMLINHDYIYIEDKYNLPGKFKGFYDNDVILIDRNLNTYQKHEVLAEEIAHYKISAGNILDQSNILNRKLELKARRLANESVITLQGLIDAYHNGISNIHEMADFFEVNLSFVQECLKHYQMKYGLSVKYGEYIIEFEPLNIFKN
ncbi:ImmA/IrrE family metallo-endopeptidase [Staphylococcus pseudintermedius]|nr:ImmA/IrrE family metallo-endopeptidase [Staphylococcus pseudintermedius]EGQ3325497.1 ImmA/IrrE family metallo-endopeptidase [Staphylococcus pseudintermedius]EIE3865898.1 ImmA/IrrE family metallo-endopeptidase [Staphylococcus pseudintermedius]EIO0087804.1 ImmA/IrrE family metallo-endopeptidase [Staphylococcus pseudintermedius]EIT1243509.1 ImmA/IrrE family metallo-endopeptidase [Staphylococcus pseudintermedius]